MARKPAKPSEKIQEKSKLLEAVEFLSLFMKDEGAPYECHLLLSNKTATAFNGIIAGGQIIDEEIYAAPRAKILLEALKKCGDNYSLTQLDASKLSIKAGKFKAIIPCIDPTLLGFQNPDAPSYDVDNRLKEAMEVIEAIKTENAQRLVTQSFLLNGQSIVATDGKIIFEYWHGLNLPTDIPIPKSIIPSVTKTKKQLTKIGFSNSTVTFFFDDNSWVRSQLYAEKWPTLAHILETPCHPAPIPADFFNGLDTIASFSEKGSIFLEDG